MVYSFFSLGVEKDDGDEKKYIAEEKDVKEEVKKSVSERKKEIERRLSQEVDEKKQILARDQTITTTIVKTTEKKKDLIDEKPEKETAEEKAVSPEPAHLSFDEKRKSFEMGITPKEKIKTQEKETIQKFITEEQKIAQELPEVPKEEEFMTFQEKRRSFEQGLSMKKPGDKLPVAERKKVCFSFPFHF